MRALKRVLPMIGIVAVLVGAVVFALFRFPSLTLAEIAARRNARLRDEPDGWFVILSSELGDWRLSRLASHRASEGSWKDLEAVLAEEGLVVQEQPSKGRWVAFVHQPRNFTGRRPR